MGPIFTIGLLGGCGDGFRTGQYFCEIANCFLKTMQRVRILLPLSCKGERAVAMYLLEHRRTNPGLEISVVLTAQQSQDYQQNATGETNEICNKIINDVNRYYVLEKSSVRFFTPDLFRFFIENCDHIIFNEYRAGKKQTAIFSELVRDMAVPLPVQYGLICPGYFIDTDKPFHREFYRIYDSGCYDPYAEIRQSIDFLRRNKFAITADHLPQVFIRKWLAVPPPGWYYYLTTPDDTTNIFRLHETQRHDYLSLKVFAAAFSVRNNLWATSRELPKGDIAIRRFQQFRQLLNIIAEKREKYTRLEPFDLFDFSEYDKILKMYAPHKKLCEITHEKPDRKHEPRKRIQRTKYIPARKQSE